MYHLSCQVRIYLFLSKYLHYLYLFVFLCCDIICVFIFVSCPEISLSEYIYIYTFLFVYLNRLRTNCGKSMVPFHAIWGLCWYNSNILSDID